jgi:hypothetical protein
VKQIWKGKAPPRSHSYKLLIQQGSARASPSHTTISASFLQVVGAVAGHWCRQENPLLGGVARSAGVGPPAVTTRNSYGLTLLAVIS